MPRPPLDDQQTEALVNAYYANREQAVRYALAQLDVTAFDAPALPYLEVLVRVQALIATEMTRYGYVAASEPTAEEPPPAEEEHTHG